MTIIAYVGEFNKSHGQGDWDMRYNKQDEVWEPWLINQDGEEVLDVYQIAKDFYKAEYGTPVLDLYIMF